VDDDEIGGKSSITFLYSFASLAVLRRKRCDSLRNDKSEAERTSQRPRGGKTALHVPFRFAGEAASEGAGEGLTEMVEAQTSELLLAHGRRAASGANDAISKEWEVFQGLTVDGLLPAGVDQNKSRGSVGP
jgi:hypothetical protein